MEKENGGVGSAKNVGLKYAEGEYINFFDSDDTLSTNVFKEVNDFFRRNKLCIDFVSIPLYYFEEESGIHPKYKYMGNKNRIINLTIEPYNFVLSGAASFYKLLVIFMFNLNKGFNNSRFIYIKQTIFNVIRFIIKMINFINFNKF